MLKSTFLNKSLKQTTGTDTVVELQELLAALQKASGGNICQQFF